MDSLSDMVSFGAAPALVTLPALSKVFTQSFLAPSLKTALVADQAVAGPLASSELSMAMPARPVPTISQGVVETPVPVTVTLTPVRALSAACTCAAVAL